MTSSLVTASHPPLQALPHQRAAIDACCTHLIDDDQDRARIVMPCGTGKTLVATLIADRVTHPDEAVLVTVPTLALLEQTVREWMANSPHPITPLAFCSDQDMDSPDYADLMVPTTTSPENLAHWVHAATSRVVVFATYQSTPAIAVGHADGLLRAWGVIVADEAHRTVTMPGSVFATIVDQELVAARKRVFLTATPRTRTIDGTLVSMSNEVAYGRLVYHLSVREAIAQRLLSDYEVVIVAVTDDDVATMLASDKVQVGLIGGGHRNFADLAKQVALARVAADRDVHSAMVFHNTVAASEQFADTFTQVARAAHPPTGLSWSAVHVDGYSNRGERRDALAALRSASGGQRRVVSNVKVFTEGLDVPALDAVMFADPRTSQVDVAQAVGRVLRTHPGDPDRKAVVILPVLVGTDRDSGAMLPRSAFAPVVHALQALMDADPALETAVRSMETMDPKESSATVAGPVTVHAPPELTRTLFGALRSISGPPVAESTWERHVQTLEEYISEHGELPRADTVYRQVPVGKWVVRQRYLYRLGELPTRRAERLVQVPGWVWSARDAAFGTGYGHLLTWLGHHGNVSPEPAAIIDGFPIGQWVTRTRRAHTSGQLPDEHRMRLEMLPGWTWDARARDFDRGIRGLARWRAVHGELDGLDEHVYLDGFALGYWWSERRRDYRRGTLRGEKAARLAHTAGRAALGGLHENHDMDIRQGWAS